MHLTEMQDLTANKLVNKGSKLVKGKAAENWGLLKLRLWLIPRHMSTLGNDGPKWLAAAECR
eukprot:3894334-Alexandrium_andersonii.AAC.1